MDPDNRRPVDFTLRQRLLTEMKGLSAREVWERRAEGLPKLWVLQKTLQFRRTHPDLFGPNGSYEPVQAVGPKAAHVVAFARAGRVVTVVPRLLLRLAKNWEDTKLRLPEGEWFNEFTGETVAGGEHAIEDLLTAFPVALLARKENR